ncbi:MAG TPA: hypothetical protein VIA62_04620 [Thermoanaerobaculia bacterium]|jgi:hypothetical protein|nr:hypothetical protein [Thermoanaerobaculia bacterium]
MASPRLRSVAVIVFLVFLFSGGMQTVYGYDGCSVLPQSFPGREVLQESLDELLGGACGRHDTCYSTCLGGAFLQSRKHTCDLVLLLELEDWCNDSSTRQEVAALGISPDEFVRDCDAAMLAAYAGLQTPIAQAAYDAAQTACDNCVQSGGTWDPTNDLCIPFNFGDGDGGRGGLGRCPDVDPATIANCELGGWWEATLCLCLGDGASPIIVDLTGNGFRLTGAGNGVDFDINGDGVKERLGWTRAGFDEAFLVLDRNQNGKIDDGTELFGNFTVQPPSRSRNGFRALAMFDQPDMGGNGDGKLTAADLIFSELRLWTDLNHDGVVGPLEMWSLADWGVVEIDLNYKRERRQDQFGNQFRYKAGVTFADHRRSFAYDVFLVEGKP